MINDMDLRFWVDERVACCAVRDRMAPQTDRKGLDSEMKDVLKFWSFPIDETCPFCHQTIIDRIGKKVAALGEARKLRDKLNESNEAIIEGKESKNTLCPQCGGDGGWEQTALPCVDGWVECPTCKGEGYV